VDGGLYSAGDAHFAQGDSECCLFAIEIGATHSARFRVHKGEAERQGIRWPRFAHDGYFAPPEWAAPRRFIATVGMPVTAEGVNDGANLSLAARNAMQNMVDLLLDRGWTAAQAYVLCSVAVDLRVSNVVDLPNVTVSALLPEDIFV
jgi:formamidase